MYIEKFWMSEDIPEIFKMCQAYVDAKYPQPEVVREPEYVPMPKINSNPNVPGPLKVTKQWYVAEKQKAACQQVADKAEAEVEVIKLLAKRDRIYKMLPGLHPGKKKEAKQIAKLNCQLNVINTYLETYRIQYGFDIDELEHGSRFEQVKAKCKRKVKKVVKKIKRFINDHLDATVAIASAATSLVVGVFTKLII